VEDGSGRLAGAESHPGARQGRGEPATSAIGEERAGNVAAFPPGDSAAAGNPEWFARLQLKEEKRNTGRH